MNGIGKINMSDFFQQYFVEPIVSQGVAGYNVYNTTVYAILFALAAFATWKILKALRIKIDRSFAIGILPFILVGGVLRVVRDARIVESPLLVTPLIYFVVFAVAIAMLLVSVGLERALKTSYHKVWCSLGLVVLVLSIASLVSLGVQNWNAVAIITVLSIVWAAAIFVIYKLRNKIPLLTVFTKENSALLWAHMFDASTTFTALQFFATNGYYEQHVVSGAVIDTFGPVAQFALKLIVLIPVLWLLDRELARKQDAQLRGFIKIAILILGLALGARNGIRLVLGV